MTRSEQLKKSIITGIYEDVEWLIESANSPINWGHVQLALDHKQQSIAELLKTYINVKEAI